jgi:hypothetical protein
MVPDVKPKGKRWTLKDFWHLLRKGYYPFFLSWIVFWIFFVLSSVA